MTGDSIYRQRVMGQISGLPSFLRKKRLLMVLQAYIDESYDNNGWYVIGGHIADANSWLEFSDDWAELLPKFGILDSKTLEYHFHMKEMAQNQERMEGVAAFYRLIEKHVTMSLIFCFKKQDLEEARQRIQCSTLKIDWNVFNNPYIFAFRGLMDMFHSYLDQLENYIPSGSKIDFIFDDMIREKKIILEGWDDYISSRPEQSYGRYGATPRFENDREFLPLQGADLWCWWTRKWLDQGKPEIMDFPDFELWQAKREDHMKLHIEMEQDGMVKDFMKMIKNEWGSKHKVYDTKGLIDFNSL